MVIHADATRNEKNNLPDKMKVNHSVFYLTTHQNRPSQSYTAFTTRGGGEKEGRVSLHAPYLPPSYSQPASARTPRENLFKAANTTKGARTQKAAGQEKGKGVKLLCQNR